MIDQSAVKNKSSYYFLNKETKKLGKYDDLKKGEGISEEGPGIEKSRLREEMLVLTQCENLLTEQI